MVGDSAGIRSGDIDWRLEDPCRSADKSQEPLVGSVKQNPCQLNLLTAV